MAFPTETVYGLGVDALDRAAVRRIFDVKGRPASDPLIVHVATFEHAAALAAVVPDAARRLAQRFWPGPLTLVLPRAQSVPLEVTAGLDTVAIRVPAHPVAQALLHAAQLPIAAPSANLFSRPSPTRASHVLDDLDGRIDMVLDAGPTVVGVESTVLDLTTDPPTVLRPGGVSVEALREVLPTVKVRVGSVQGTQGAMPSPGLLSQHYAPRTPMTLYQGEMACVRTALLKGVQKALAAGQTVGVLATSEQAAALRGLPIVIAELGSEHDIEQVATRLYAALRQLDAAHVDVIFAHDLPEHDGLSRAVRDRLRRASTQTVAAG